MGGITYFNRVADQREGLKLPKGGGVATDRICQ